MRVRLSEKELGERGRQTMLRNDELEKIIMTHCRAIQNVIL